MKEFLVLVMFPLPITLKISINNIINPFSSIAMVSLALIVSTLAFVILITKVQRYRILLYFSICYRYLVNNFKEWLLFQMGIQQPILKINRDLGCASVVVFHSDKKYTLYIPYDMTQEVPMLNSTFIHQNIKDNELQHPPGLPLLISPNHLGGGKIMVIDNISDEVKEYTGDSVIGFPHAKKG
jgi:hypothetical protein